MDITKWKSVAIRTDIVKLAEKIKASYLGIPLIVFNAIDTFLSLKYIKFGPLHEMNPMVDWLLAYEPYWFITYKLFFVATFILILKACSHKKNGTNSVVFFVCFVFGRNVVVVLYDFPYVVNYL